jgi:hypothetical protein
MKSAAIVAACLAVFVFNCYQTQAKCLLIPVNARGTVSGEIQDGDGVFLRFLYSAKRVESSSVQLLQRQAFTVEGAYSTFTRMGLLGGHVCKSAPRLMQVVLQDRNGVTLDTVDLTVRDPSNGVTEVNYGEKQAIVLNRHPTPAR